MVALPDGSLVLCGGKDATLGASNINSGDGISNTAVFADCWRSWDRGVHWEQQLAPDGSTDVGVGPRTDFGMVHVGGGRVVAVGGTSTVTASGWLGVTAATFCL